MIGSFLGKLLQMYVRGEGRELREIAGAINRHPSQISRLISGDRCALTHDELERLAGAVSPDRDVQANLIVAYLLDQCPPSFRTEIGIQNARGSLDQVHVDTAGESPRCPPRESGRPGSAGCAENRLAAGVS